MKKELSKKCIQGLQLVLIVFGVNSCVFASYSDIGPTKGDYMPTKGTYTFDYMGGYAVICYNDDQEEMENLAQNLSKYANTTIDCFENEDFISDVKNLEKDFNKYINYVENYNFDEDDIGSYGNDKRYNLEIESSGKGNMCFHPKLYKESLSDFFDLISQDPKKLNVVKLYFILEKASRWMSSFHFYNDLGEKNKLGEKNENLLYSCCETVKKLKKCFLNSDDDINSDNKYKENLDENGIPNPYIPERYLSIKDRPVLSDKELDEFIEKHNSKKLNNKWSWLKCTGVGVVGLSIGVLVAHLGWNYFHQDA